MANVFLNGEDRDIETAIMLEKAIVHDIGNAVAYTDGNRIFVNTDDNLYNILPAYDHKMLKWLLWHERYHKELRHHNRFFKYLSEVEEADTIDQFRVTKEEVNIIMDILVHDSLSKLFPELIETAVNNLAQMRNRNSLGYTFTTFTLEEMLEEYSKHKHREDKDEGEGAGDGDDSKEDKKDGEKTKGKTSKGKDSKDKSKDSEKEGEKKEDPSKKGHGEGGSGEAPSKGKDRPEDGEPEEHDAEEPTPESEHEKTDWSKLENIDSKEFITEDEAEEYLDQIAKLKRMKAKLGKLTETLNGLVTSVRRRTYAKPNPVKVGGGIVLKGSRPGKVALYLIFDASGSMSCEMNTFKDIISKAIPQAMTTPTTWFSGWSHRDEGRKVMEKCQDPKGRNNDYYKGTFQDFMKILARGGYDDDGDRTIELCYLAEQAGYTPIGVTDGGGQISWSKDKLKKLQRTIFVGSNDRWLKRAKEINPRIQILCI